MLAFLNSLRYTIRQLRRAPGFASTVIATLALGIGASTFVFSIVDAVLLRPLPFPHPDRLVELQSLENLPGGATRVNDTSYPNFFDWRDQSKSFQSMATYKSDGFFVSGPNETLARRVTGILVSSDFFSTIGVQPIRGRGFLREEERAGNRSVVIGSQLEHELFGAVSDVVGKTIRMNDEQYSIVGVMPDGFQFPLNVPDAQLWVTLAHDAEGDGPSTAQRGYNQLSVIGRLRNGVKLQQARAEINSVQQGLALRYPDEDKNMTSVEVLPELDSLVGDVRAPLGILFAAVTFLLLIASANAGGLFLTRVSSRLGELSIRTALGASRKALLGQLLLEALLLSLSGGLLGVGLAAAAVKAAPSLLPADLVRAQSIGIDSAVLGFAFCAAIATGLLFGVLPAWKISNLDPAAALAEGRRSATTGRRQHRLHAALVLAQTALSLVLLCCAGLLLRSFNQLLNVDPGFDPQHVLTFRLAALDKNYSDEQRIQLYRRVSVRLQALPGVESVTSAFPLPLTGANIGISFAIAGQPVAKGDEPSERVSITSARFFETLRIPLRRGRFFSAAEQTEHGQPVVIVNEAFAKKYFPNVDPIGQHLRSGLGEGDVPPMREVVGVVGNVKRSSLAEPERPEYYIPFEQAPIAPPAIAVRIKDNSKSFEGAIRSTAAQVDNSPADFERAVRSAVAEIDPSIPVYRFRPYVDDLARTAAQQRFQTWLIGAFAAFAIALAAIGIYGLLAYMVVLRTSELGLRIALGAQRLNVLGLIVTRGIVLATSGLALGLVASLLLTRFLSGILFKVKALDPITFAAALMILWAVAVLASLLPAYRASQLDPVETLRMN